ncbi:BrnA antitoxin family protein [Devosia ginsengisoli]|nr:BrnA antitoxin family protein [Devosia ginsengisoli]
MSNENAKMVRYTRKPLTQEQIDRLKALSERPDSEIDYSDIPPLTDEFFKNAKQGMMYRLVKQQTTLRLDADILDWFKRHAKNGKGYQTDINKALRAYVVAQDKKAARKAG